MFDKLTHQIPEITDAISIESRETYHAEELELENIGYHRFGTSIYNYFRDTEGNIWFVNLFIEPDGRIVEEYEHLFGKKERRKKHVI